MLWPSIRGGRAGAVYQGYAHWVTASVGMRAAEASIAAAESGTGEKPRLPDGMALDLAVAKLPKYAVRKAATRLK